MFVDLLNLSREKVFLNELLLKDQLACLREIDAQAEIIDKSDYRIQQNVYYLNKMFTICGCKFAWRGRAGGWSVCMCV